MHQFDDVATGRFFTRISFYADPYESPDLAGLRDQFANVGDLEQMEWAIFDAEKRPRVLIMVSKFDHCLVDLFYRNRTGELNMEITAVVSNQPNLPASY